MLMTNGVPPKKRSQQTTYEIQGVGREDHRRRVTGTDTQSQPTPSQLAPHAPHSSPRERLRPLIRARPVVLFDEVVPVGTLLLMSVATNLATQHAVPEERGDVGLSGSIVWRAIKTRLSQLELGQKITQTEKGRAVRQKRKREKALEAAGEGDGAQALRHSLRV